MISEIEFFSKEMQRQLDFNSNKGSWKDWNNLDEMLVELEYHKSKLYFAIKENNLIAIKEYIGDCANILFFIGNKFNLYNKEDNTDLTVQMIDGLFITIDKSKQTIKDKFTNGK